MDPINQPTGLPTGNTTPVGTLSAPAAGEPVNPAQAPTVYPYIQAQQPFQQGSQPSVPGQPQQLTGTQQVSQQSQQQVVPLSDYQAMQAHYEGRVRNLMSEKDKALNERNQSIAEQARLQQQYAEYQNSAQNGLATSTQAAQMTLEQNGQLRAQVAELQGQVLRSQALAEHPELLPYSDFIPAINDAEKIKESVTRLQQIRERDRQQSLGYPSPGALPQQQIPGMVPTFPPQPQLPGQLPQTNAAAMYGNRPQMAPMVPGSNPAMMSPMGATSSADSIAKLLKDAMDSGDQVRYEAAVRQAATMANAEVQQQQAMLNVGAPRF